MAKYTKEYPLRKVVVGPSDATATPAQFNEQVVNNDGSTNVVTTAASVATATLQNAVQAIDNGTAMDVAGLATVVLNVTGTFVATITFEVSSDDTNWDAIPVAKVVDGVPTTTATTAGQYIVNVAGFKSLRARISAYTSGAVTVTGRGIAIDRSMRGVLLPEVTGTPGQAAPGKAVQIGGYNGSVVKVPYVSANIGAHGSGWAMGVEGFVNASLMYANNGSSRDTWMNNTEGTLLQSAARTATTPSPNQTNYNARGVIVWLNITAASGTGGLTVRVEVIDPVSGAVAYLNAAPTARTGVGLVGYAVFPGTGTVTADVLQYTNSPLPRTWRVRVVHGDGSSYTYSVGYALIV